MAGPVLLRHGSSLEHDTGRGHPESHARIAAVEQALEAADWLGWGRRESQAASADELETIHSPGHADLIEGLSLRGGGAIDMDTTLSAGSYVAATHAAGGALALVDALLGEGAPTGASLHRPPGHHAEAARAMGFCLFNNVALAARRALDVHGARRVLIVDWDVHHGNGTNDIFHADADVLFCSIHQSPLYPGTGPASDEGAGAGLGHTVNLPVPGGSGDDVWCALLEHVVAPLGRAYAPGLVLVSAGFDAHAHDPLAGCAVSDAGFATMAASVRALGADLGVPVGLLLEGGYDLGALGRCVVGVLGVLGAAGAAARPDVPRHPLAEQHRLRLCAGRWPALAA